jgi:hypothetical protein|tara:strand:+ start:26278 stop:26901 length:624 start_codon:yes stop_codon:yes gene_type:complete
MAAIFDDMLLQGIRSGKAPARTSAARDWYRAQAKGVTRQQRNRSQGDKLIKELKNDSDRKQDQKFRMGNMYLFAYDPKHKDTLPYYDRFPLIFPINRAKGGFLGINMHYLPPILRAKLMDQLYTVLNNRNFDETTKLTASYKVLAGAAKFSAFAPCVKHYLNAHVRSQPAYINPSEWDIALFLPTQKFVGASANKVYQDSRKIVRGR